MTFSIKKAAPDNGQVKHEKTPRNKILIGALYFIILILYWFVFKYIDPVGLENATKNASSQFFSAITQPFYGYGSAGRSQSHIAVVEVSDSTLSNEQLTWPVSYHREAYWLRNIIEAHPAAVLVDIYFNGEREGDSLHAFDAVLAEAKSLGVPVFFVGGMATDLAHDLPPPLKPYQVYSGWKTENENMYPMLVSAPRDQGKMYPTPALAMYSALCEEAWKTLCKKGEEFEEPMFVRWGVYSDPLQKTAFNGQTGNCEDSHANGPTRLLRALNTGLHALKGKWQPPESNKCFYALTMDADYLDKISPLTSQPYTDMLRGRAVFFGGDLQAIHDVTQAPAIGQVPAVQLHAMAFDNLLTYGPDYFHEAPKAFFRGHSLKLDIAELIELTIWVLLSLLLVFNFLRNTSQRAAKKTRGSAPAEQCEQKNTGTPRRKWAKAFKRKYVKCLVAAGLCLSLCVYDCLGRGHFSATIALLYVLLFVFMICMPLEFEAQTYIIKILQTVCICSVFYCVNELFLHFPNADWIGLALLWFTVPEVNEDNGFVKTIEKIFHLPVSGQKP